ncbi:uncharacterized protein TNCV_962971 [Trichonephila clavipes]|nr:uncharacterized protein TNCV_962971 [Trichonephila clavipes]
MYLMTVITEQRWFKIIASHNLIQVLGTIQALMLYKKRADLRKIVGYLTSILRSLKPVMKVEKIKVIHKCLIVVILIMFTFQLVLSQILAGNDLVFLRNKQLPQEHAFNMNISWKTTKLLVRFASLSRQMNFIWMDSFLLYYCLLCYSLKSAFEKFRMILLEGKERSKYLHIHNSLTKAVSVVDDAYSSQIFICFSLQLISIFLQVFLMKNISHHGIFPYHLLSSWMSLTFIVVVICASRVGESAIKVKETICSLDFNPYFENWNQLLFKISMTDAQLTVWKFVSNERESIRCSSGKIRVHLGYSKVYGYTSFGSFKSETEKKLCDGKNQSGRNRLTDSLISKIQRYYRMAIRNNINDLHSMKTSA